MRTRTIFYKPVRKAHKVEKPLPKRRQRPLRDAENAHITRAMRVGACRKAVFNTAELLEEILLQLPLRDVIVCRRVCKHFQSIISQSSQLQFHFMLRPSPAPHQTWTFINPDHYSSLYERMNMCQHDIGHMRRLQAGEEVPDRLGCPRIFMPTRLSPLLKCTGWEHPQEEWRQNSAIRMYCDPGGERVTFDFQPRVFENHAQSWEELYLCDPPMKLAYGDLHFNLWDGSKRAGYVRVSFGAERAKGLRFEDLIYGSLNKIDVGVSWEINGRYYCHGGYPWERIETLEKKYRVKAELDVVATQVTLCGVVIPTEEEWATVR